MPDSNQKSALSRPFWGLLIIVLILPFHAFLVTSLTYFFELSQIQSSLVAAWKEMILFGLSVFIISRAILKKKFPFKIIWLDKLILALFVLGLGSILYGQGSLTQSLWGLRTDFEFFLAYFVARSVIKSLRELKILAAGVLGAGALVIFFGLLQIYFLPPDFLVNFGYGPGGPFIPGQPLPSYQAISGGIVRIDSTLAGPIQLGPYLAMISLLALSLAFFAKSARSKLNLFSLSFVSLIPLYCTYTRASWLGFLTGFIVLIAVILRKKKLVIPFLIITILLMIWGILYIYQGIGIEGSFLKEIILREKSTAGHLEGLQKSLSVIKDYPFGLGLGTTGPASFRAKDSFINESWYLQIATEMGILGLSLFLGIMAAFLSKITQIFRRTKDIFLRGLALGLSTSFISISVVGIFLHAWADNIVISLTFWILAGGLIQIQIQNLNKTRFLE